MRKGQGNGARALLVCCWMTYLTAYLCRVNFSRAMTAIHGERGIPIDQLGAAGALFFLIYACGQLINGFLGDRVRPVRFLMLALAGTALCNAGVGLCRNSALLMLLWGVNGYFQSVFWSTIVRLLARGVAPERRSAVSLGISSAMPAAYLVSWCVLGNFFQDKPVGLYFIAPAIVGAAMIAVWAVLGRGIDREKRAEVSAGGNLPLRESVSRILRKKLWLIMPMCVMYGVIKEGVGFWAPKLIEQEIGLSGAAGVLSIAMLPLANMLGMLLGKLLLHKNPLYAILFMFFSIALAALAMILSNSALLIIAMMAAISGLSHGNNMVLMSFIPMHYARENIVATLAGLFDFSAYVGAAISTYALGHVLEGAGFAPLPRIWLGAALLGALLCAVALHYCGADMPGGLKKRATCAQGVKNSF